MIIAASTRDRETRPARLFGARNLYTGCWATTQVDSSREVLWYETPAGIVDVLRLRMRAMGLPADEWEQWFQVHERDWKRATLISTRARQGGRH